MNKSLSAQIVPLLVLVVALLGVSAYVFDLEPKTEVKTSIEGLLPNQTDAEFGGLYLRYPDNWIVTPGNAGGYEFSPKDDPTTVITAVLQNTTPEEYLGNSQGLDVQNYCANNICGFTWTADAADQFDLTSYLIPVGDGQSIRFDYQTPPGEDVNQEIIDGMIQTAEVKPFIAQTLDVPPFAQVVIPANWQGNVQPAGASGFQSGNLTNGAGNLALFPVTMDFVPELFSITIPEGDATPEVILQTVLASVPPESFIEPQGPVTIGNHSGSMAVLLNSGNTFEIGVLAVGEEHALVYSMETSPDGFEAFRSDSYDIIRTIQWDVPGVDNVSVDSTDEGTTEDTAATDETEGDTSEGDTSGDTSEDGTTHTPPDEPDGISTESDDTTTESDTTEGDTSATEGDTTGETDTTEDTSETGDTEEPVQVEVNVVEPLPLGEAFVNEATGLSVAVPEGFDARGDSNFTYLTQGTDSIRYFVGTAEDVASRFGIEVPAEGTPNALLTAFVEAEAAGYDEVSDVLEFDNYAYVDATRGSSIRRFAVADLGEGQLVYIEAKATTANFDVFGATTLATIKTLSMGEAPATSGDTENTDATATSEDTSGDDATTSDENTTDGTDTTEGTSETTDTSEDTSETGDTDATDSANTDETDTTEDTDVVAPELTETASGSIITSVQYPADWEATVGQMGDTPFENAELVNDTSFINIIPVPMELTPVLFQMNLLNEDITPEAVLTTLVTNMPATTLLVADVTPLEFDNYSGAYIVVSSQGRSVEIGVLQAGDTDYGLVYSADMDEPNFAAVHATIQAVLPTVELDLDALATASGNDATSDTTEDSADTTSAEDTTGDDAVENTEDTADTSGEDTATDDSAATAEETAISEDALPLGDPFTNEELGLTVNVPEGFNPRADSNYLYVDQVSSSVRFAVGPVEEIAIRLGLELESYPNQDIAVNLMTLFAAQAEESGSYDSVSAVTVNDNGNRAYVDVTRSSTKRRFIVMELEDGRLLYVETKAPTAEFDVMSATTMAMLQSMTIAEPVTE